MRGFILWAIIALATLASAKETPWERIRVEYATYGGQGRFWEIRDPAQIARVQTFLSSVRSRWRRSPFSRGYVVDIHVEGLDRQRKRVYWLGIPTDTQGFISRQDQDTVHFYDWNQYQSVTGEEYSRLAHALGINQAKSFWDDSLEVDGFHLGMTKFSVEMTKAELIKRRKGRRIYLPDDAVIGYDRYNEVELIGGQVLSRNFKPVINRSGPFLWNSPKLPPGQELRMLPPISTKTYVYKGPDTVLIVALPGKLVKHRRVFLVSKDAYSPKLVRELIR